MTQVTHIIDLAGLGLSPPYYTGTLYIAAHAVLFNSISGQRETGWADNALPFPGNSWALYFIVELT